mmetsp:Transcript_5588/g.9974  ORF Transcript_5588/g.9974 Transcript_5588/m.9974 type:complete len:231 (+) Transcript_5588:33-725(+)
MVVSCTSGPGRVLEIEIGDDDAQPSPPFQLLPADQEELQVAVVRRFFSKEEVAAIHALADFGNKKEIKDRDDGLIYKHHVWRMENELKDECPRLYQRLMDTARSIDAQLWHGIEEGDRFFPEIEYIVYDVKELGEPGTIEPHCDNQSQVSMVMMLSSSDDFSGGINFFEGDTDEDPGRSAKLQLGDAVFFYGDRCEHWITPVTAGRRVILQMELSRGWIRCSGLFDWLRC